MWWWEQEVFHMAGARYVAAAKVERDWGEE